MKKIIAAFSLAVASLGSYASVITEYQTAADFPEIQNDLGLFTISGNANGNNNSGVNLIYTFDAHPSNVGFNITTSKFSTLSVQVTAVGSAPVDFTRTITDTQMFWGFSAANSHISSVKFFTASTSGGKDKTSNDKITIDSVVGYVQPIIPSEISVNPNTVPEPATMALLGLGLLGFAASRRKSGKSKNA